MNYKVFTKSFVAVCILVLMVVGLSTIYIDPFFHYHKPNPEFYYVLRSQRYQNNGILKHFDYNAIITGTSMTENFKTTEFDELFDVTSVKVSYSGAKFKELNDAIKVAYKSDKKLKYVVRSLDLYNIAIDKDTSRNDLGEYPVYLYNDDLLDDLKYIFSRKVFFSYTLKTLKDKFRGKQGGITSFDEYSNWNKNYRFGKDFVLRNYDYVPNVVQKKITSTDLQLAKENIKINVIDLASAHPETTFYYFIPPYSMAWWGTQSSKGELVRVLEAEKLMIEMILECPNIKLFSFNLMTQITTDLNNYKDTTHYGEWINSDILKYIKEGKGLLTRENYQEYLKRERELYMNYGYNRM